jgi:hypothetical protein
MAEEGDAVARRRQGGWSAVGGKVAGSEGLGFECLQAPLSGGGGHVTAYLPHRSRGFNVGNVRGQWLRAEGRCHV